MFINSKVEDKTLCLRNPFQLSFVLENMAKLVISIAITDSKSLSLLLFCSVPRRPVQGDSNQKAIQYSDLLLNSLSHELITPIAQLINFSEGYWKRVPANMMEDEFQLKPNRNKEMPSFRKASENLKSNRKIAIDPSDKLNDEVITDMIKINCVARGLDTLCHNLLDYGKIINKSFQLNTEWVNLYELSKRLSRIVKLKVAAKGISFKIIVAKDLFVMTDQNRLLGVLYIFVENSIKFTNSGGILLKIEELAASTSILFQVIDTGIGIDDKDLEKLSKIVQNNYSEETTKSSAGACIGFRIANAVLGKLTKTHKYFSIRAKIGEGTVIKFKIPSLEKKGKRSITSHESMIPIDHSLKLQRTWVSPDEPKEDTRKISFDNEEDKIERSNQTEPKKNNYVMKLIGTDDQPQAAEGRRNPENLLSPLNPPVLNLERDMKHNRSFLIENSYSPSQDISAIGNPLIIIVDDDVFNLEILKEMLEENYEFEVYAACNGDRAIELCNRFLSFNRKVDLILMDYNMPLMTGAECTKILRSIQYYPILEDTPIIGITAHNDDKIVKLCLRSGMNRVEQKPFSVSKLSTLLKQLKLN